MQVFIIGTPLETAMALDPLRLNKQLLEIQQILDALNGKKAWSNHPCVLQYRGYEKWLRCYNRVIKRVASGDTNSYAVFYWNWRCSEMIIPFHTQEYFDHMKRRLYTKNKEHYKQWAHLGESQENWYFVDGEWRKYINGKRIE